MVLDRRSALAGVLLTVAIAGCGSAHPSGAANSQAEAPSASQSASPASSPPATGPSTAPSSAATIVTDLCLGADVAQNTADAYMGALSAGNATQAMACVLPDTVPAALTRSLLAKTASTAVYLPRDGVDGPAVFGYRGNSKLIDVTVTKRPDGRFWVTKVAVRNG